MSLTPEQRLLKSRAGQIGAYTQWSRESDPSTRTAKARRSFLARFEAEVDPNNELDHQTRARMAEQAKRAYFLKLALKSSRARAARKAGGASG